MRSMRELGEELEQAMEMIHLFPSRFENPAPPSQGHPPLPSPGRGQRRAVARLKKRHPDQRKRA